MTCICSSPQMRLLSAGPEYIDHYCLAKICFFKLGSDHTEFTFSVGFSILKASFAT